jgi:hypothetical protein
LIQLYNYNERKEREKGTTKGKQNRKNGRKRRQWKKEIMKRRK